MENPKLQIMQGNTELATNDDWSASSNAADLTASGIPPQNAKEAAILLHLESGAYTTIVSGVNNSTGISLVEVYEIHHD